MKPNYDKLRLGLTLENNPNCTSVCHNYGVVSGCDDSCPALLSGDCGDHDEVIPMLEICDKDKQALQSKYKNNLAFGK